MSPQHKEAVSPGEFTGENYMWRREMPIPSSEGGKHKHQSGRPPHREGFPLSDTFGFHLLPKIYISLASFYIFAVIFHSLP